MANRFVLAYVAASGLRSRKAASAPSTRGAARTTFVGRLPFSGPAPVPVRASFVGRRAGGRPASRACARPSSSAGDSGPFTWTRLQELFQDPGAAKDQGDTRIASDHPNLALFRRSRAVQAAYQQHTDYLKKNWRSPYDYLLVSKFGERFGFKKILWNVTDASETVCVQPMRECSAPPDGHVYASLPAMEGIGNEICLRLVPNDFPYDVQGEHWCLWKVGGRGGGRRGISPRELTWALEEVRSLKRPDGPGDDNVGGRGRIVSEGREEPIAVPCGSSESPGKPSDDPEAVRTFYWVNPPHLQSLPEIHHAHILVSRTEQQSVEIQ